MIKHVDLTGANLHEPKAHKTSHQNGGSDEISVAGLSGELADDQPPKAHASDHTDGTDDIQDATSGQKGLATATQITKLDALDETPIRTIVIIAGSLSPATTSGCAAITKSEVGSNKIDVNQLAFDKDSIEHAFINFVMPDSYNGGTITAQFIWTAIAGTTGNVIWGIKGRAYADDDGIDQAHGTEQEVTDAFIAQNDVHISAATSALTLAGSPAGGQLVHLDIYRDATDAGDTFDADANLIGIKIEYTASSMGD